MNYNRRSFLKMAGGISSGIAFGSVPAFSLLSACNDNAEATRPFGIQLYTLRDDMPKDPQGVLKKVASFGYNQIESYEGAQGIFWGMGNKGFKKFMDELGMKMVSSHCDINKNFEQTAAEAAEIGVKYLLCPWIGPQNTLDDYKKYAAEFNKRGEICKKNGIRFGYHNHDYSFLPKEGQYPQDIMMNETDPSLVDFEMDIYWVVTANQDPETWLKKYKNRFKLSHVKDRMKNTDEGGASCDLGKGKIDFAKVLKTARENGMEYFITEQERYDGSTPLKSVEANANYMRNLKY